MKLALALSVALLAVAAGPAHAAVQLKASVSPSKAGTPENPMPAAVTVTAKITGANVGAPDGSAATQSTEAKLPYPLLFNPVAFPSCSADQVRTRRCSSNAKIGSGSLTGGAAGGIVQQLKMTAYNGKGYAMLLLVEGATPLRIDAVVRGTIRSSDEGKYGMSLLLDVPENLQQPVSGVFATVTNFSLKVDRKRKIKGKTVSYVSTAGCVGGRWPFAATVTYRGGTTDSGSTSTRCS
jgi:hypothetical protein